MRNWIAYYVMLMGTRLIFFKDHKVVLKAKKAGTPLIPVGTLDLIGATADIAYGYTKKKHVFSISSRNGTQVYLQTDSNPAMMNWMAQIQTVLKSFSGETVETVQQQMTRQSMLDASNPKKKKEEEERKKKEEEALQKKKKEDEKLKKAQEKAQEKVQKKAPPKSGGTLKTRMSTADLETIDSTEGEEKKTKIKKRLLLFFSSRPTIEALKEEGVIQGM